MGEKWSTFKKASMGTRVPIQQFNGFWSGREFGIYSRKGTKKPFGWLPKGLVAIQSVASIGRFNRSLQSVASIGRLGLRTRHG
jgi:hypothetical protein